MEKKCPRCGHQFETQIAPELKDSCPKCLAEMIMNQSATTKDPNETVAYEGEDHPLKINSIFAGMKIIELLGKGGMGFVYKAHQLNLHRDIALKVLAPKLANSPEFTSRFQREAKALAQLNHANVVQVFDHGKEGEFFYLVMEYVDGTTLRHVMNTQKVEPTIALKYIPQICDALEYAHTKGVIHRDIKPANILIDLNGQIKIADFGLAKMRSEAINNFTMTNSGDVMGTPHYMAPEQTKGMSDVDHRADIYSLGVVFYEMLTGDLPLGRFPNPSEKVKVNIGIDEVVLKALEVDPELRYQRISEVKNDVTQLGTKEKKRDFDSNSRNDRHGKQSSDIRESSPKLSKCALFCALGLPLSLGVFMLVFGIAKIFMDRTSEAQELASVIAATVQLLAIISGIASLITIRTQPNLYRGTSIAKFGIFFPLGLLFIFICFYSTLDHRGSERFTSPYETQADWTPYIFIAVILMHVFFSLHYFLRLSIKSLLLSLVVVIMILTPVILYNFSTSNERFLSTMQNMQEDRAMESVRVFDHIATRLHKINNEKLTQSTDLQSVWKKLRKLYETSKNNKHSEMILELEKIVDTNHLKKLIEKAESAQTIPSIIHDRENHPLKTVYLNQFIENSLLNIYSRNNLSYNGNDIRIKEDGNDVSTGKSSEGENNYYLIGISDGSYQFFIPIKRLNSGDYMLIEDPLVDALVLSILTK